MSPVLRALLGAALGSCIALFADPTARSFMTGFLPNAEADAVVADLDGPSQQAFNHEPQTLGDAGMWLQIAAERMVRHRALSKDEQLTVLAICRAANQQQPENAYWLQMAAVLLGEMDRMQEAKEVWIRASKGDRWDNLQAPRLEDAEHRLESACHAAQAWHYSANYYSRNKDAAFVILSFARRLISQSGMSSQDDAKVRLATLQNGVLLRDGSKSLRELNMGIGIVEVSCHPSSLAFTNQKTLILAQNEMTELLGKYGMKDGQTLATKAFRENESKQVLTSNEENANSKAMLYSLGSLLTAGLPGATLIVGLLGAAIYGIGCLVAKHANDGISFNVPTLALAGVVVGILVYSITRFPLAAAAPLLSFIFLRATPKTQRKKRSSDLGPLFGFTVLVITVTFVLLLALFLVGYSPAAVAVAPVIGIPDEFYGGSSFFLSLSILLIGILLFVMPFWAFAQRISTPYVLGIGLRRFGTSVFALCLVLTVLGTPLAIYADSQLRTALREMSGNEPLYYLRQ